MPILVLNAGSSTLKATLLEPGADEPIGEATVEWPAGDEGASDVVRSSLDLIPDQVDAVGYRVVHGGSHYTAPSLVDESLLEDAQRACRSRGAQGNRRRSKARLTLDVDALREGR